MATAKVSYKGHLRTECQHEASGQVITTDAPTDNHGRGEAFSPTDLTATSLATCMMTVMAIEADRLGVRIREMDAEVLKVMGGPPRRIIQIEIGIRIAADFQSDEQRNAIEKAAHTCPVALSLHPDIRQIVRFTYSD